MDVNVPEIFGLEALEVCDQPGRLDTSSAILPINAEHTSANKSERFGRNHTRAKRPASYDPTGCQIISAVTNEKEIYETNIKIPNCKHDLCQCVCAGARQGAH